ncbi:Uncharacterised protein [Raoultella planticola]|uniref:Uncharacterized protein n=1 Tax=Raoultella planticola TaxID=575 RepID=A0A485AVB9_RAOPL|nr:Uncharacterised protein [Raoultella planticola]
MLAWTRTSRDDDGLLLPVRQSSGSGQFRLQHGIEIDEVSWQQFKALEGTLSTPHP